MPALTAGVASLRASGVIPCLATVRVGDRADDVAYERTIARAAERVGIDLRRTNLPSVAGRRDLLDRIGSLNADPSVHGVLMFRPLPSRADEAAICAALDPRKDVDGVTPVSMSALYAGRLGDRGAAPVGFAPCTAEAVLAILRHFGIAPAGKRAVVIGRSAVIGKPVSLLLLSEDATVTICHSKTVGLAGIAASADILIVAAGLASDGRDGGVDRSYFNAGQTVIDVGIHADADGTLYGDVNADEAMDRVADLTPVPGGVGAVTTLILLEHVLSASIGARRDGDPPRGGSDAGAR
jgi:methylenetetrahydrofolate dehydrogenase (NADP+)/methenyltetrahydrofolate cyclohydrolase